MPDWEAGSNACFRIASRANQQAKSSTRVGIADEDVLRLRVLVKAYCLETRRGSLGPDQAGGASLLFTSLHALEIRNALRLKRYRKELTESQLRGALRFLQDDIESGFLMTRHTAWRKCLAARRRCLRKTPPPSVFAASISCTWLARSFSEPANLYLRQEAAIARR